jgi:hypothetical protein
MEIKSIDIMIVLGPNVIPYLDFFKSSVKKLSSGSVNFIWKCVTTNKCKKPPKWMECVGHVKQKDRLVIHGYGLNILAHNCTSDVALITHPDISLLCKNWDELLLTEMADESVGAIGGVSEDRASQYKNCPSVFFTLFRKNILESIDFLPKMQGYKQIISDDKEKYDTGWRIPGILIEKQKQWVNLTCKSACVDQTCCLKYQNSVNQELRSKPQTNIFTEYYLRNTPIATHFGSSSRYAFDDQFSKAWQTAVKQYIEAIP